MDGWMDGWMDGSIDGWMGGRMDGQIDRQMDGQLDEQIVKQLHMDVICFQLTLIDRYGAIVSFRQVRGRFEREEALGCIDGRTDVYMDRWIE